jgi:PAS domain S-box-containing protein
MLMTDKLHNLLRRQLKKVFGAENKVPKELMGLIGTINEAYCNFDADRLLLERSIEISSQELLQANAQTRSILNAIPDLFARIDSRGTILECKMPAENTFDIPAEGIDGKNIYSCFGPTAGRELEWAVRKVLRSRKTEITEYSIRNATESFYEARVVWLSNDQLIVIARDITHRKKIEERLRESQRTLQTLMSNLPGIAYRCRNDQNWTMEFVSDGCTSLTGYQPADLVNNSKISYTQLIHPDDREMVRDKIQKAIKEQRPYQLNYRIITASGKQKWVWGQGRGVFESKGELIAIEGLITDISDIKIAEQKNMALLKKLNTANRDLKEFAAIVSHNLQAPLRGIGTLAQWLVEDYKDKFDQDGLEKIDLLVTRVRRLNKLMDSILQYSTTTRDAQNEFPVDINRVVELIVAEIKPPENIRVTVKKKLPIVNCEESHILQILYNLVENAVKFMDKPQGRIIIDYADRDDSWEFSITDNGRGINEKYFNKIFRLFQTLSDLDPNDSTGMGLTLTRKIVELYGGKVWVTSKVGQGSTFYFTLPKQAAAVPAGV